MPALSTSSRRTPARLLTDDDRWQVVLDRDVSAVDAFVFSVRTTGIYCRPTCPAKLPRRENVRFYKNCDEAEAEGFRACKRCQPRSPSVAERQTQAVTRVCRLIEESTDIPSLDELADAVGLSRFHLHRVFKKQTGVTPKAYAAAHRARRTRDELNRRPTITDAIYGAGFNSNSRFYESSAEMLGMLPSTFRAGGSGTAIRFAIGACWLGSILVASSEKGVCAIFLGDEPQELARHLQKQFPKAELIAGDKDYEQLIAAVVHFLETPSAGLKLPLDIRGTAFQQRVWQALCEIPPGTTVSYTDVARRIGQPKSVRAVASACAANNIAVAIPCHRVVRSDGELSGYRWGVDVKRALLEREEEQG